MRDDVSVEVGVESDGARVMIPAAEMDAVRAMTPKQRKRWAKRRLSLYRQHQAWLAVRNGNPRFPPVAHEVKALLKTAYNASGSKSERNAAKAARRRRAA